MSTSVLTFSVERAEQPVIDKILRLVPWDSPVLNDLRDQQTGVTYDRKKGIARYLKHDIISKMLRKHLRLQYYFVDGYERVVIVQKCEIRSSLYHPMELRLTYTIGAEKGLEPLLVQHLARRDTPARLLTDMIYDWTDVELKDLAPLAYTDFAASLAELKLRIAGRGKQAGLHIDLLVESLLPENMPIHGKRPVTVRAEKVRIQPDGFNGYLYLNFDAVLTAEWRDGQYPAASLAFRDIGEVRDLLTTWMQTYIRKAVAYQTIINDIKDVRRGIIAFWDDHLQQSSKGWQLGDLEIISHFDLKDRLDQLRGGSMSITTNVFNDEVQLEIRFAVAKVDTECWDAWSERKYATVEDEKNSIMQDINYFYRNKLEEIVEMHHIATLDLAKEAEKFEDACVDYIRRKRHLIIRIENIYEGKNGLKAQRIQLALDLFAATNASIAEKCKKLLLEIAEAEKNDPAMLPDLRRQLEECLKQLMNPSIQPMPGRKAPPSLLTEKDDNH